MRVKVYLVHFGPWKIRTVTSPNNTAPKDFLDTVFHYGQNDFQPLPLPSVSVGDVIENPHDGRLYRVEMTGFQPLPESGGPYVTNPDESLREVERQLQLDPKNQELRARYRRMCVRSGVPELAGFEKGDLVEITLNPNHLARDFEDPDHLFCKLSFKAIITRGIMSKSVTVQPLEYIWCRQPPIPETWDQDPWLQYRF